MTFFAVRWCCCPMCTVSILTLWSWNTDGKFFWQLVGNMTLKNILPHRSWSVLVLVFRKCWKSFFQKKSLFSLTVESLAGKDWDCVATLRASFSWHPHPPAPPMLFWKGCARWNNGEPLKNASDPLPPPFLFLSSFGQDVASCHQCRAWPEQLTQLLFNNKLASFITNVKLVLPCWSTYLIRTNKRWM